MLYFKRYAKLMAPDWAVLNAPDLIGFLFETVDGTSEFDPAPPPLLGPRMNSGRRPPHHQILLVTRRPGPPWRSRAAVG